MSNFVLRSVSTARRTLQRARLYATEAPNLAGANAKPSSYGQPLFQSHPHLLQPHELTPGIPAEDYEQRRRSLIDRLPENSLVVCVSAPVKYMSNNIFYKYRQASNFWYLTGFDEPDSAVILEKTSSSRGYQMTLFCKGKDPAKEKWDGARTSVPHAAAIFRADEVQPIDAFPFHLESAIAKHSQVYADTTLTHMRRVARATGKSIAKHSVKTHLDYDAIVDSLSSKKRRPFAPEIARLRGIKSPAEQRVMRAAADISGHAHAKTMRFARPGISEAALAAHFEYLCAMSGAQRPAYVPVVASGVNFKGQTLSSSITHQTIILFDQAKPFSSTLDANTTRTFPASGTFTEPQRDLYAAVLSAQKQLVALCHESAQLSMHDLHRQSCGLLQRELKQLGFDLKGNDLEHVLYPHFLSHPIGIDLHESSYSDRSEVLKEGMVITVEPGIYVPPSSDFPTHFHGIGIRIEDEVLVGKTDPIVLSVAAPKEALELSFLGLVNTPLLGVAMA
ncbi:hypothetical protein C0995_004325 [Termitomyces sp. Mi166|nr:hypothetical protein C0995_004325 [Termitomyces sp. Mi166\